MLARVKCKKNTVLSVRIKEEKMGKSVILRCILKAKNCANFCYMKIAQLV